ncbi:MAG: formylglycine-generating enzyme family protein [Magnetococcales bacterium]|nr:formylglycine-generating enzyme family protein [Magnetococcales bacterium]
MVVSAGRFSWLALALVFLVAGTGTRPAQAESELVITNTIGMELVRIPAGRFIMGSDSATDPDGVAVERPAHAVEITRPFYLGRYEVTQAQWLAVMASRRSQFSGMRLPVENVSWEDIQEFLQLLNEREKSRLYRLPSEAEWEYAARAGTTTIRPWGDDVAAMERHAWFGYDQGNALMRTHPVGQLAPNAWGLHDMLGNVWEWVADWHGRYEAGEVVQDPVGPERGRSRIVRGGSWNNAASFVRVANRHDYQPDYRSGAVGFRLAMTER